MIVFTRSCILEDAFALIEPSALARKAQLRARPSPISASICDRRNAPSCTIPGFAVEESSAAIFSSASTPYYPPATNIASIGKIFDNLSNKLLLQLPVESTDFRSLVLVNCHLHTVLVSVHFDLESPCDRRTLLYCPSALSDRLPPNLETLYLSINMYYEDRTKGLWSTTLQYLISCPSRRAKLTRIEVQIHRDNQDEMRYVGCTWKVNACWWYLEAANSRCDLCSKVPSRR
jgi:hypothetical protein